MSHARKSFGSVLGGLVELVRTAANTPSSQRLRRWAGRSLEIVRVGLQPVRAFHPIHIVSAQRECAEAVVRCMESVHRQRYPRELIRHVVVDDQSRDRTPEVIQSWLAAHPGHRVDFWPRASRRGMLMNNVAGFAAAAPGAIGIELNGDDWLPDPGVLAFVNRLYQSRDLWMTYNTLCDTAGHMPFVFPPRRRVVRDGCWRRSAWVTSHLHTFRVELYWQLPEWMLTDPATGEPWDFAQDLMVYLALLELGGHRSRHVWRVTCTYHPHPQSEHVRDREGQVAAAERIRSLTPLEPLTELPPPRPPVADSAG